MMTSMLLDAEEAEAKHMLAEPTVCMLKATTLSATRKVVVEPFRPIVHILEEKLHQVAMRHVVDVVLQT
jgi:hypothetical protein